MPVGDTSCPLMASTASFSRKVKPPTIANYLSSTSPIFLPSREAAAGTISIFPRHPCIRGFFFPPVCALPIGMFWTPIDLSLDTMSKSVKALAATATSLDAIFTSALEILKTRLHNWLIQLTTHPLRFACQAFCFATVADQFPSLSMSAIPSTVSCVTTFDHLIDMRYLCAWRLLLDSLLSSTASKEEIPFLRLLLSRVSACMHPGTYLELRLELTPRMAFRLLLSSWRLAD